MVKTHYVKSSSPLIRTLHNPYITPSQGVCTVLCLAAKGIGNCTYDLDIGSSSSYKSDIGVCSKLSYLELAAKHRY